MKDVRKGFWLVFLFLFHFFHPHIFSTCPFSVLLCILKLLDFPPRVLIVGANTVTAKLLFFLSDFCCFRQGMVSRKLKPERSIQYAATESSTKKKVCGPKLKSELGRLVIGLRRNGKETCVQAGPN